jgi:hypothetical protein
MEVEYCGVDCINCSFLNCFSTTDGGAVGSSVSILSDKDILFCNCTFSSNKANETGGAIMINFWNIKCSNCTFLHNIAKTSGSSVYCRLTGNHEFISVVFIRNILEKDNEDGTCITNSGSVYLYAKEIKKIR